jgi:hypothetical protein
LQASRRPAGRKDKDDQMNNNPDSADGYLRRRPRRAAALAATAAIAGALLLAACGGASHSSGSGQPTAKQVAAFAQCMRDHGLPNFYAASPQSVSNTSSPVFAMAGNYFTGGDPGSPQFQSAFRSCKHLFPGASHVPPAMSKQQIDSLVKSAQCMHAHGFPSYPEPDIQNGRELVQPLPSSIDTSSPQYQAAAKACNANG